MTEKDLERERVAWVFGLTGGELESKPLRYAYKVTREEYRPNEAARWLTVTRYKRGRARYWYEGVPECMPLGRKLYRGAGAPLPGSWRTLVWNSGSYGDYRPPQTIVVKGERWRKVASYSSSGETACPVPESHPGKVTREEARLEPPNPYSDRPKARRAFCPMCGAHLGEEHGYLYLGEGWCEVVYYKPDPKDEE